MKNLLLTALVVGLIVLGWHPGNGAHAAAIRAVAPAVVVDSIQAGGFAHAPMQIVDATVEGDMLVVNVAYDGGCKVHDFHLVASNDVQAEVVLVHQDYGDACAMPVSETLRFDLSAMEGTFDAATTDDNAILLTRAKSEPRYAF